MYSKEEYDMSMMDHLNPALLTARRSAIREFSQLAAGTPDCVRLTLGEPDFITPAPIRAAVTASLDAGHTHYIQNNGVPALRERIASFCFQRCGLDYAADDVIVTAGATEALFVSLFGILSPGDEVVIPQPAFVLYRELVNLCRGVTVPMDTAPDGFQLRSDALAACITPRTKAIVLNSPNNPTGCVYDRESLDAVYRLVRDRDIFVICDDVYRGFRYGAEYHSFAEYRDLREKLLVVQSFSKMWAMTGWRMGWLLADASVRERLDLVHQYAITSTPAPFQEAAIAALDLDVSGMAEEYARRRGYVLERLAGMGLSLIPPDGAFYVFPSIEKYGLSSTEFCTRLLTEAHVAVTPGAAFGADGHIRISYACGMEDLRRGMDRLERFLHTLDGRDPT